VYKENEFSPVGKFAVIILLVIATVTSLMNILYKHVPHPGAFVIICFGFLLFLVAKLSVILRTRLVSFGSRFMTENMGNIYRVGYWLMVLGFLLSFTDF
jgi:hypothetical protein